MAAQTESEICHILELKKSYKSDRSCEDIWGLCKVADSNFTAIVDELLQDVSSDVIRRILEIPYEERVKKLGPIKKRATLFKNDHELESESDEAECDSIEEAIMEEIPLEESAQNLGPVEDGANAPPISDALPIVALP